MNTPEEPYRLQLDDLSVNGFETESRDATGKIAWAPTDVTCGLTCWETCATCPLGCFYTDELSCEGNCA
jgi:hypothetical protein